MSEIVEEYWMIQPFYVRMFILFGLVVTVVSAVRFARLIFVTRFSRVKDVSGEEIGRRAVEPLAVARAAIADSVRPPDSNESSPHESEEEQELSTRFLAKVDREFLYIWDKAYILVQSTKMLAVALVMLSGVTFFFNVLRILEGRYLIEGQFTPGWALFNKNIIAASKPPITGFLFASIIWTLCIVFEGILMRRKISWAYTYETMRRVG